VEKSLPISKNNQMRYLKCLLFLSFLGLVGSQYPPTVHGLSTKTPQPQITLDSFTGVYHLSRDSRGLSLLTTEETILADFPGEGSFYGITRSIPKKFQNHSVSVKILNISDAAGNIMSYKTTTDANNNLVVTTGDPSIILYGSQTIKIRYQTSGVIDLGQKSDEFLLNVNGRGWDQAFNRVDSTLYVPSSFGGDLESEPLCYTVLGTSSNSNCKVKTIKNPQETTVTASASPLNPHQALVVKLQFKPTTFTNKHAVSSEKLLLISAALIFAGVVALISYLRKSGLSGKKL
jgi:hypothetical protein